MNFCFLLLLPLFQNLACGKHFLVETEDSQNVEENARKQFSHELSAEGAEKTVDQACNHFNCVGVIFSVDFKSISN